VRRSDSESRAAAGHPLKYCAFLSYSHADAQTADWLHGELEKFRTPSALVGRTTHNGAIPKRLTPIFRDRHELPASDNLADAVRASLDSSRFLIVLCSPAAAKSRWVNAEIDMFKRHRPDGCVLAAIIAGEPFASDIPGREAEECLPPALRQKYDRRGRPTTRRAEPLAADLREAGDGKRLGLLKLVSGMLGVGLDELVQRDTLRRQRRLAIVAAASLAGMAVTSTLAVVAIDARDAARDQRREAEGLVGFMLGDLRSKLEPLGRLDVLDSVGARALEYYEKQDTSSLSDAGLAQRSKALTLIGEIAHTRGNLDAALRLYRQALAGTAEALRRAPENPQRVFDHAQNVFWVGYIAWQRGGLDEAERRFREYKQLADRMIAIDPAKPEWRLEAIYADTNLGTLQLRKRQYHAAAATYQRVLDGIEPLAAAAPGNEAYSAQLRPALAYLAVAHETEGARADALGLRERQLALLDRRAQLDPGNNKHKRSLMSTHRALGQLFALRGELAPAEDHMTTAVRLAEEILRTEPANTEWAHRAAIAYLDFGELELARNRLDQAGAAVRSGCSLGERLAARDRSVVEWRSTLRGRCLIARGRIALERGAMIEASALAEAAAALARAELEKSPANVDVRFTLIEAASLRGKVAGARGDPTGARRAWQAALRTWPSGIELTPRELALRSYLLRKTGLSSEADAIAGRLAVIGYRHPEFSEG
jgi:tetratricopeptide (TPR) repeat protein